MTGAISKRGQDSSLFGRVKSICPSFPEARVSIHLRTSNFGASELEPPQFPKNQADSCPVVVHFPY